jgi:hypothetical protein
MDIQGHAGAHDSPHPLTVAKWWRRSLRPPGCDKSALQAAVGSRRCARFSSTNARPHLKVPRGPSAGHESRRQRVTLLKYLDVALPDIDDKAVTGLREIAVPFDSAQGAARAPLSSESGLSSPDGWDADDAPESELPVPEGELLAGRYVVERKFAEGGMGIVCLGRHAQLNQPVAIKFLRRALSGRPSVVQRFLNEARALAQLRSEHVVRVMDVGQLESGRPYLVMEHLEGIDLDALVDRDGPLSVETAVSYVLQVCEPLAEAHSLGIVHRDIKPENLFLWSGGPAQDIVKVLDFGLAKQLGSSKALGVTGPQDSIGSPCYMSPEQITTPQSVDARTDIWSLGVVLHRLLTDTLPFDGASLLEVLSHVLSAAPKSICEIRPSLDSEIDGIVHRCLEKSADARYGTMNELSDALRAYLAHRSEGGIRELPRSAPERKQSAPESVLPPAAPPFADDEKIRIAGVHSRWPGVLAVLLVLGAAALYQADKTGRVRLRDLTDGWLTPARLAVDGPTAPFSKEFRTVPSLARGVFSVEPASEADGAPSLRAEPELDRVGANAAPASADSKPISESERIRRIVAYRAYAKSKELTRLPEPLPSPEPEAPPPAEATDNPYR